MAKLEEGVMEKKAVYESPVVEISKGFEREVLQSPPACAPGNPPDGLNPECYPATPGF